MQIQAGSKKGSTYLLEECQNSSSSLNRAKDKKKNLVFRKIKMLSYAFVLLAAAPISASIILGLQILPVFPPTAAYAGQLKTLSQPPVIELTDTGTIQIPQELIEYINQRQLIMDYYLHLKMIMMLQNVLQQTNSANSLTTTDEKDLNLNVLRIYIAKFLKAGADYSDFQRDFQLKDYGLKPNDIAPNTVVLDVMCRITQGLFKYVVDDITNLNKSLAGDNRFWEKQFWESIIADPTLPPMDNFTSQDQPDCDLRTDFTPRMQLLGLQTDVDYFNNRLLQQLKKSEIEKGLIAPDTPSELPITPKNFQIDENKKNHDDLNETPKSEEENSTEGDLQTHEGVI